LFERHVGQFFTFDNRPIKINKKGMADMYGLIKTDNGLIHIEIEIKSGKGVQTKEQKVWQKFIESMNGLYIVGREPEQVENEVKEYLNAKGKS